MIAVESGDPSANPYDAPGARIEDALPGERLPVESAGRWRRFFGFLIDYVCATLLRWMVAIVAGVVIVRVDGPEALDALVAGMTGLAGAGVWFASVLVYYTVLEGCFGWTIGKLVTGTRVVDASGLRPRLGQVLLRGLVRFVPLDPFSLLLSADDVRRSWHDWLSRTWVVRRR